MKRLRPPLCAGSIPPLSPPLTVEPGLKFFETLDSSIDQTESSVIQAYRPSPIARDDHHHTRGFPRRPVLCPERNCSRSNMPEIGVGHKDLIHILTEPDSYGWYWSRCANVSDQKHALHEFDLNIRYPSTNSMGRESSEIKNKFRVSDTIAIVE